MRGEQLLVPQRLDVAARMPLARAFLSGNEDHNAMACYLAFLKSLNPNANFGENGAKYSFEDYVSSFASLARSINEDGYRADKEPVPIGPNGFLSNGAHRVAIATQLNMDVPTLEVRETSHAYDEKFLVGSGLQRRFINLSLLEVPRAIRETRLLILFDLPALTVRKIIRHLSTTGQYWGSKNVSFQGESKKRLVKEVYGSNEWFRPELLEKMSLERMGSESAEVCFILVDIRGISSFREQKEELRETYLGAKFPRKLHGTDSEIDTLHISELIFSEGGEEFLRLAPPGSEERVMAFLRGYPDAAAGVASKVALSGSSVMELHGIRPARDFDLVGEMDSVGKWDNHNDYLQGQPFDISQLLWQSNLSFIYSGHKILNLRTIAAYKIVIGGHKNSSDITHIMRSVSHEGLPNQKLETRARFTRRIRSSRLKMLSAAEYALSKLPPTIQIQLRKTFRFVKNFASRL